jgi:general nucleoside transport system ATP-binding protein
MTPILKLVDITKRFGNLTANDAISLSLNEGEILALLGENGAGKTTLMNILFGHYTADEGHVEAFGNPLPPGQPDAALDAGIGMVHQHFSLADNLSVLENIILGTEPLWSLKQDTAFATARINQLSKDFGLVVDPKALVGSLTVGERQRVEILKALYREARILILDEPTAVLTPQESDNLFETLRSLVAKGMSIIFISHKLNEILSVSDRVMVIRRGKVVAEQSLEGADRASLAEAMVGHTVHEPKGELLEPGEAVFDLKDVSVSADEGVQPLSDVNLSLRQHEIVGLAGVSGNGQQTLAGLISGIQHPESGTLSLYGQPQMSINPALMVDHGVGRIPEDRNSVGVIGEMSVRENLISEKLRHQPFSKSGFMNARAIDDHADKQIKDFDVRCQGRQEETRLLSGGNVQKLILARVLDANPSVLLANQPSRGLDVGAVAYVHEKILEARARGAGVLLISEDLEELMALSDRIVVIYHGRLSPSLNPKDVTAREIGLMMSGQSEAA